jgi:hypothetical protein
VSLHSGTRQPAIIFIVLVLIDISCAVGIMNTVAAVVIDGWGTLIERDM